MDRYVWRPEVAGDALEFVCDGEELDEARTHPAGKEISVRPVTRDPQADLVRKGPPTTVRSTKLYDTKEQAVAAAQSED